jgi:hypothetical protein
MSSSSKSKSKMRNLLTHKTKHYKAFADAVVQQYRQIRYGIGSCRPSEELDLAMIRKECVDWQSNDDHEALCHVQTNYKTWLPVSDKKDALIYTQTHHPMYGAGYYNSPYPTGPQSTSVGYAYHDAYQNIIEVNAGGCMTRINLNPSVVINNNQNGVVSFEFTQSVPVNQWNILHNMGFNPNVRVEDQQGNDIVGAVTYVNLNQLTISFNQPVAGTAYLS